MAPKVRRATAHDSMSHGSPLQCSQGTMEDICIKRTNGRPNAYHCQSNPADFLKTEELACCPKSWQCLLPTLPRSRTNQAVRTSELQVAVVHSILQLQKGTDGPRRYITTRPRNFEPTCSKKMEEQRGLPSCLCASGMYTQDQTKMPKANHRSSTSQIAAARRA